MTDETLPPDDAAAKAAQQAISGARKTSGRRARASHDADVSAEADPPAAEQTRVVKSLAPQVAEFVTARYRAYAPDDMTVHDLTDPRAWFAGSQLKLNDIVEVVHREWFAMCLVTDCGPGRTMAEVILYRDLLRPQSDATRKGSALPDGYVVRLCPPGSRSTFEVFRPHDQVVISRGTKLHTEREAEQFAVKFKEELVRSAARAAASKRGN